MKCQNCNEEVAYWSDHIHSLPNKPTSYSCVPELEKLHAEVERLKAADEAAGQAAFELQCQTMNERDQWRAVADCLFNVLTEDETNCEAYMNAYDSYKLALNGGTTNDPTTPPL
jgi:hypothetical protein